MGVHKAYIHRSYVKKYHRHKPVFIPFDVKNISVVAYVINRIECFLNILKGSPVGCFCFFPPFVQRLNGVSVFFAEFRQYCLGYNYYSIHEVSKIEIIFHFMKYPKRTFKT